MAQFDLAIVGAGIGGSALAVVMARAGYKVLLPRRPSNIATLCVANGSRPGASSRQTASD